MDQRGTTTTGGTAWVARARRRAEQARGVVSALVRPAVQGDARREGRADGWARDAGMATAEYAIVMIAAVGFAGLLIVILSSAEVREALTSLVRDALSV